ncbi:MAG: hypothetical protein AAGA77_16220 [Bacteroidota bacterium]
MILFEQFESTFLYTSNAAAGQGFLGFYLTEPEVTEPSLTLTQVWSALDQKGYIIFCQSAPEDLEKLASAISTYRSESGNQLPDVEHTSIAWLTYASISESIENVEAVQFSLLNDEVQVTQSITIKLGQYGMPFMEGERILLNDQATIAEDTLVIEYPNISGSPPPVIAHQRFIPLAGDSGGTIQCEVAIGDCTNSTETGWNIGIRYFYEQNEALTNLYYPVFELEEGDHILLDLQWDPLLPLDNTRSVMRFKGGMFQLKKNIETEQFYIQLPENPSYIPSAFRSVYGHQLYLIPNLESEKYIPGLVFQPLPDSSGTISEYYLVPTGEFHIGNIIEDGESSMLAGLSGTEYFNYQTFDQDGSSILFYPDSAAFAPVFPLQESTSQFASVECNTGDLLCNTYVTAWIGLSPSDADYIPLYYSQPETSPLFAPSEEGDNELNIMPSYPAASAAFVEDNIATFPMLPYGLILSTNDETEIAMMSAFESSIVAPWRRQQINQLRGTFDVSLISQEAQTTTTPQGLLATIEGFNWTSVLLAKSVNGDDELKFTGSPSISSSLQESMQSDQLFLVATLAEPLGDFENEINIEGWPFTINPEGENGTYANVLILKFCKDSIADRAANTKTWSNPDTFNSDPSDVSAWINNYITDAENRAIDNDLYLNFIDIVYNESWNGILALKVDIGLDSFPDDLKGLLGGIDLDQFNGHHFGIEVNYVEPVNGTLTVPKSSMFGLISYFDASYALANGIATGNSSASSTINPGADGYNFTVLYLQVVFTNSTIADFDSLIQLSATSWFGEPAYADCTVDLIGSYEKHNDEPTYSFTTQEGKLYQFYLNSSALFYIQIVKARFNTINEPAVTGDESEEITPISSSFSFWGYLNFIQLENFDPLSFGDPVPNVSSVNNGLYFYNLAVLMDMLLVKSGDPSTYEIRDRTFEFSEENTSFDTTLSTVHNNSLYPNFPLTISALTSSKAGTFSDLGYVQLQLPSDANFSSLGDEWYGLVCTLNLGSMGALASLADFTAKLLIAWSTSEDLPAISLGLRLPGSAGEKYFSFENVLQLSTDAFIMSTDTETQPGTTIYSLIFQSIGMSLLGIKFPQGGSTHIILYGNPDSPGKIGWYGQYAKNS